MQPIRPISVTLVAAAAGDYLAADIISNSVTDTLGVALRLPNFAVAANGVGTIVGLRAKCSEDAVLVTLRLHFYNLQPLAAEVEMEDNVAMDLAKTGAGRNKWVGSMLMNPFVDRGTAMATSDNPDLFEPFQTLGSQTNGDLFMVAVLETAEANETAGMTIDFTFYVI